MLSYLFCHEWFPPMYFFSVSQCNCFWVFFCALRVGRWHIYTCLCSYPGEVSSTSNVTPSTDNSVPTLNSTTMLSSSQVDFFFHVRREFCLKPSLFSLTVLPANGVQTHCNLGMPNVWTSKVNTCKENHFARVSFASSPFWHKQGCGHPPPSPLVTRTKM